MTSGVPNGWGAGARPESAGQPGPLTPRAGGGWTPGRVVALVIGSLLAVMSLGLLGGGGTLLWADLALRHGGYLTTPSATYSTPGYALASERVGLNWGLLLTGAVGDVRLRATSTSPDRPVFIAVGPADRVAAYLSGAAYATVPGPGGGTVTSHPGAARPAPPGTAGIWTATVVGTGTQVLQWTAQPGDWTVVAMNADGSAGVAVRADAGVSSPGLPRLAAELIAAGVILGALSAALVWVPVRLAAGTS